MHAYRNSPFPLQTVEDSLNIVLGLTQIREPVCVELKDSLGCCLSQNIYCNEDFPPFRASIMDGYAVIAEDCPNSLKVVGVICAGNASEIEVTKGCCVQITTGSPVPKGADAVVKVEDTEVEKKNEDGTESVVKIRVAAKVGQSIRPIGSDIGVGQLIVSAGDRLGPTEIGLLASLGIEKVFVYPPPVVAVLSTGNELVELGNKPALGQIRDSNRPMLLAALAEEGVHNVIDLGIAQDSIDELEKKILDSFLTADILISSGGVSMGELDLLKPILERIGTIHFGRILMKPGKPCTFATLEMDGKRKLIFGLPGNPVSSLTCFTLFCIPCFRKASGLRDHNLTKIQAKIKHEIKLDPERPEYLRVLITWERYQNCFVAESTGNQISSRLLSFRSANGLLVLPQQLGILPTGTAVDALIIGPLK